MSHCVECQGVFPARLQVLANPSVDLLESPSITLEQLRSLGVRPYDGKVTHSNASTVPPPLCRLSIAHEKLLVYGWLLRMLRGSQLGISNFQRSRWPVGGLQG